MPRGNRDQYNIAFFVDARSRRRRASFTNSEPPEQRVIIANYYIQDFGAPGLHRMFNVHFNPTTERTKTTSRR